MEGRIPSLLPLIGNFSFLNKFISLLKTGFAHVGEDLLGA